jgi:hypothetical protein
MLLKVNSYMAIRKLNSSCAYIPSSVPPQVLRAGPSQVKIYSPFRTGIYHLLVPNLLARKALRSKRPCELELELIQPQMAQKPMLRGEDGARALRVRSVSREEVLASAGVQGAWVSGCGCEADRTRTRTNTMPDGTEANA